MGEKTLVIDLNVLVCRPTFHFCCFDTDHFVLLFLAEQELLHGDKVDLTLLEGKYLPGIYPYETGGIRMTSLVFVSQSFLIHFDMYTLSFLFWVVPKW